MMTNNEVLGRASLWFNAGIFSMLACVISFIVWTVLEGPPVKYGEFVMLTKTVPKNGIVEVKATYTKSRECPGEFVIALGNEKEPAGFVILSRALGNRSVGTWTIVRRFDLPKDEPAGRKWLQETLLYDCGLRVYTVRSPNVEFELLP